MGKNEVLKSIRNYKEVFGDVASQIVKINGSQEYTDEGKRTRIADIESKNEARRTASRDALIRAVDELQGGLIDARRTQVKNGLADADKINLVVNGINSGAFDKNMVSDILDSFEGNPFAVANIRQALATSDNYAYKEMALSIPKGDDTSRVINGLGNISKTLKEEKPISSMLDATNDFASASYLNGGTFDGWITYIEDYISE